jgi:hypothetical protein
MCQSLHSHDEGDDKAITSIVALYLTEEYNVKGSFKGDGGS